MTESSMWTETHLAVENFFQTLTCKKCQKHMRNPKQFMNCGHFACGRCVDTQTDCVVCKIPGEKHEIHSDSAVSDLLDNLIIIAEAVEFNLDKNSDHGSDKNLPNVNFSNINIRKPNGPKIKSIEDIPSTSTYDLIKKKPISTKIKANDDISNASICESSVSRSTSQGNKSLNIPKNINKKNAKGETALHCACRKNHGERVKVLLEAGADPNTKDNAGWTPLQEAVSYGYYEVCELLLKSGANPNMYGQDNRTALHEAVKNDDVGIAALLLKFCAKKKVFDNVGKKPKDYSKSKEMADLLSQDSSESNSISTTSLLDKSASTSGNDSRIILFGSNLKSKNRKLLMQLGNEKKIKVVNNFSSIVTHLVLDVRENQQMKLSFEVLLAILQGKSLINSDCLEILMENDKISNKDLEVFDVNPPQLEDGPNRCKENKLNQLPPLFNNCYFYFTMKNTEIIDYDGMKITKEQLIKLVEAGDGIVLKREPKPDDIQGSLTPFHVAHDKNHSLHKCTHYVIIPYDPESNPNSKVNRFVYNFSFLKTLPLMWFIESILRFQLIDPKQIGLLN